MQAEYRRDTHHSYLVLYEPEKNMESFQLRMFLENEIPGFLPCRMYDIDCSGRFFYDISSRQSLVSILETRTMSREDLETLITSILCALDGLQNYLLDSSGFCLKAEWIFSDPSRSVFEFCYFPEGGFKWKEQLQQLSEYLLPHLEHKNREAVRLGYDFYQYAMEEKITASELNQLLYPVQKEETDTKEIGETSSFPDTASGELQVMKTEAEEIPSSRDDLLNSFFEKEELEEKRMESMLPRIIPWLKWVVPLIAGGSGASLFWFFGYDGAAIACLGITAAVVGYLLVRSWRKGKEKERDATMEQYVIVQDWLEEEKKEERLLQEEVQSDKKEGSLDNFDENATCLLASEAVYSRLAKGYLVPDSSADGPTIPVNSEITMIGKSSQMDVILKGIGISRIHARITCRGNDCFISDMNSRNGTRVNGLLLKPEEEQLLADGDKINFANMGYEWNCYRL